MHEVKAENFQLQVQSYGTVTPRTRSFLVAQVSGQVIEVDEKLRAGSFFDRGDLLMRLDDRDYLADVQIAEANLIDARRGLSEEMALAGQAKKDWRNYRGDTPANDLVLRKPQQLAAEARLVSAEAALTKARLSLERTRITAPFAGRVLNKLVDLGQVAGNNTQVAEIYATDYIEVRLPLRDQDLQLLNLPEDYRVTGESTNAANQNRETNFQSIEVQIFSSLTDSPTPWIGTIVRTESAIDEVARQLHVIAQIDDPFGPAALGRIPLKIGEYVRAQITGKTLAEALVVPATAIYQNSYLYVVEDNLLARRDVQILWQNQHKAVIRTGLRPGDQVVTTTLGQVSSGQKVNIAGQINDRAFAAHGESP